MVVAGAGERGCCIETRRQVTKAEITETGRRLACTGTAYKYKSSGVIH